MVHADAVNVFKSGRKNLVINGGFDVWQRGTSSTVTTNVETFTADRFAYYPSGGAATISRQTFAVGQTDVPGNPKYYARVNNTTGDGWALYRQTIENPERFANKAITLSFWAKGTNPGGGKFQIYEDTYFSNVVSGTPTYTDLTVTGTWTKYSYTFNMPSHSGVTLSANDRWYFSWIQPPGDSSTAAWTLDVSQVQVEYGTTATDFEHRSYGEELALCQRYYEIVADCSQSSDSSICFVGGGYSYKYDQVNWHYTFAVPKRGAFTLESTTGTDYYKASLFGESILDTGVGMTASYQPLNSVNGYITGSYSGSTNGKAWGFMLNHASAKIAVSAEL